jgi:hypothetical protein
MMVGASNAGKLLPTRAKIGQVLAGSRCCPLVQGIGLRRFSPSLTLRAHVTKPSDGAATDSHHPALDDASAPASGARPWPIDATRAFLGRQRCSFSKTEATGTRKGVAMRRTPQLFEEGSSVAEAQDGHSLRAVAAVDAVPSR